MVAEHSQTGRRHGRRARIAPEDPNTQVVHSTTGDLAIFAKRLPLPKPAADAPLPTSTRFDLVPISDLSDPSDADYSENETAYAEVVAEVEAAESEANIAPSLPLSSDEQAEPNSAQLELDNQPRLSELAAEPEPSAAVEAEPESPSEEALTPSTEWVVAEPQSASELPNSEVGAVKNSWFAPEVFRADSGANNEAETSDQTAQFEAAKLAGTELEEAQSPEDLSVAESEFIAEGAPVDSSSELADSRLEESLEESKELAEAEAEFVAEGGPDVTDANDSLESEAEAPSNLITDADWASPEAPTTDWYEAGELSSNQAPDPVPAPRFEGRVLNKPCRSGGGFGVWIAWLIVALVVATLVWLVVNGTIGPGLVNTQIGQTVIDLYSLMI